MIFLSIVMGCSMVVVSLFLGYILVAHPQRMAAIEANHSRKINEIQNEIIALKRGGASNV